MAVFADILGFRQDNEQYKKAAISQISRLGRRYLSHIKIAFEEYKTHRLSFLESPKYEEGRLSRGYDKFYATAEAECGKRAPFHKGCDVLVTQCALAESESKWDVFATRRAFYVNASTSQDAVKCFFQHKRQLDQTMSDGFETLYQGLKALVEEAALQQTQTNRVDLPGYL